MEDALMVKGKATLQQVVEAPRVERHRGIKIMALEMVVRLSVLSAGCPLPPRMFLVLISVRSWVNPTAIV
jgi:hypothetical protein